MSNLNGDRERDAFQGRRMNLRSRKGDTKDVTNTSVSEGSDDQENMGPQLRSGGKKVVSVCTLCVYCSLRGQGVGFYIWKRWRKRCCVES